MTFKEDILRPFNYISLSLAIVGIVLAVFFYLDGKRTKSISYHIDQPSLIYDSENASSAIKVVAKDSSPIDDDVYLLTGIIWNSGNLPISNEDVRKTISVSLSPSEKILDYKIVKQTDRDIAKFLLVKNDNKSLNLAWQYFDPGYGLKFQVIYTGDDNPKFILSGKVLDVKSFSNIKQIERPSYVLAGFILLGLVGVFIYFGVLYKKVVYASKIYDKILFAGFVMIAILSFVLMLQKVLGDYNASIPDILQPTQVQG